MSRDPAPGISNAIEFLLRVASILVRLASEQVVAVDALAAVTPDDISNGRVHRCHAGKICLVAACALASGGWLTP
jgi:hypothetical protein